MILITGATGLLGSRLAFDLVSSGKRVRAMRRESSPMNVFDFYFKDRPELLNKVEWAYGDVTDIFSLEAALDGIDRVYHCAGKVSFQPSHKNQLYQINVEGTANLVNVCLEKGIKKLCHVSSVAALGRIGKENEVDESSVWKASSQNSSYAISKYGAEREVWRGAAEGLEVVIVNPGVIIGPGDWRTDSSVIFKQVWKGLKFYTSGLTGFVDVRDVSASMIQLMESTISNERFILVSESKSFREVFDTIADQLSKPRPSIYAGTLLSGLAWRVEYVRSLFSSSKPLITKETARSAQGRNFYSNSKIVNALDFKFIQIKKSIEDTAVYFLKWVK